MESIYLLSSGETVVEYEPPGSVAHQNNTGWLCLDMYRLPCAHTIVTLPMRDSPLVDTSGQFSSTRECTGPMCNRYETDSTADQREAANSV
jgi:hypothetical protein